MRVTLSSHFLLLSSSTAAFGFSHNDNNVFGHRDFSGSPLRSQRRRASPRHVLRSESTWANVDVERVGGELPAVPEPSISLFSQAEDGPDLFSTLPTVFQADGGGALSASELEDMNRNALLVSSLYLIPFVYASTIFVSAILKQRKCKRCDGTGLVVMRTSSEGRETKCPDCGGWLPWKGWDAFWLVRDWDQEGKEKET